MKTIMSGNFKLYAALALGTVTAAAAPVQIASDLVNESNSVTGSNVAIQADSSWAAPPLGAMWISFADTGVGGAVVANSSVSPFAIFTETFHLSGSYNTGSISIWADDTATVLLDGNPVGPGPSFTLDAHCSGGGIGCEPHEFWLLSLNGLGAGAHTLAIEVYQLGGGPAGLLYYGSVESGRGPDSAVPEPGSVLLLGPALAGLMLWRRRR